MMPDLLLAALTTPVDDATRSKLQPIPWPKSLAPKFVNTRRDPNGPMPKVDVVVSTFTEAEGQALADVFTPGHELSSWTPYRHDFASYESELTGRSPAREAKCIGQYAVVTIGSKTVALVRNEFHLATDSKALPLRRAWGQIITETECSLWIDTGTAGGIGPNVVEGDAVIADHLVFDCTGEFKSESWAHQAFACTWQQSNFDSAQTQQLMTTNAGMLRPEATRDPKVWLGHDVITCDSFLFDDAEDSFGLETYDQGSALVEEMDAAVLGLVAQDVGSGMPKFTSVRSVSDPRMPKGPSIEAEKKAASQIYLKFGYAAQVSTLCAVWQVIADL